MHTSLKAINTLRFIFTRELLLLTMNRFFLLLLMTFSGLTMSAQVNVKLHVDQLLGDEPFAYNMATSSDLGYAFEITRLQYYISEIRLVHDGGIVTPVTDLYLLVDPAVASDFDLGSYNIATLEKIEFSIGVDSAHNHLDPTSYPNGHPLAPQNPSMHWGWISGYRFIAIEGFAGADSTALNNNYQIHTVGDQNYKIISLDVSGELYGDIMEIHIEADNEKFLNNLDVSSGLISHASTGASKIIADNTRSVFSAAHVTSVIDPTIHGSLEIFPNPTSTLSTVKVDMPGYINITCSVMDLTGQVLYAKQLDGSSESFLLETVWPQGIYFVGLSSGKELLAIEKLVIH
jgi:hypothetical protein